MSFKTLLSPIKSSLIITWIKTHVKTAAVCSEGRLLFHQGSSWLRLKRFSFLASFLVRDSCLYYKLWVWRLSEVGCIGD